MKKAYCALISDFNNDAEKLIKENGIDLTLGNLKTFPNEEEVISILEQYDILIAGISTKISKKVVDTIKTPKVIATLSIGTDHIAREAFDSPLITVLSIKHANVVSVAEHIFGLILSLNKRIYESNQLVIEGKGHKKNLHERPDDISNKTLGLIGAGNISREVIKIARVFNMKILCYTKHPDKHSNLDIEFVSLDDLLKESDIISINIPLNVETENMISKEKINLMKPTATFINTSRDKIVDIESLIKYADENKSFYVGMDIDLDDYRELFNEYRENVIITPHIAGVSKQAIDRMDMELANKILEII